MTNTPISMGTKVGRGRRSLSQLWQVPMFLVGLLALIGVAASTPWRLTPQQREFDLLLFKLRDGLENGENADKLAGYAEEAKLRMRGYPAREAETHFLIGSAYYRQAQQKGEANGQEIWRRAAEHLESAYANPRLAEEDRSKLQYRLGYSLYQQKKDVPRALELMSAAVEKGAEQPLQGYRMLVEAYLQESAPNLDAAVTASRRILDLTPARESDAVARARLQLGELLLRKDQRADAIKEFERLSPRAPRDLRIKAGLLHARACEEDGQWKEAIAIWQKLLMDAALVEGGRARVLYALGWCNHKLEPANDPETVRVWAEALRLGGPAGQAAGLRLGQLRLSLAGMDVDQALADWTAAFANVNSPQDFKNAYIPAAEVRTWLDQAVRHFQESQDPKRTQVVAELLRKIVPGGEADYQIARAAEAFAQQLADKEKAKVGNIRLEDVQAQFRRAGAAFEQAAAARPEADRSDALWRGAQCYLAARDALQAQRALRQFVAIEKDETRLAEAWFTLGDLYRAAGQKDDAAKSFKKCIEVAQTLFANRSRYYLAVDQIERKEYAKGRDILEQILRNPTKDMDDRPTQEQTLFKMGSLLMVMEKYKEAKIPLEEFFLHFPNNPNALLAREQFGECHRRLAKHELAREEEERNKNLPDDLKPAQEKLLQLYRDRRKELLMIAIKTFHSLADELEARARKKPLGDIEQMLLRRASFDIGECWLDGEEFGEALRVFESVQGKHRRTLEGFFACWNITRMAVALPPPRTKGEPDFREKAQQSMQMVLEDLQAMPRDHEIFHIPRMKSRDGWFLWVQETQRALMMPPRMESGLPVIR